MRHFVLFIVVAALVTCAGCGQKNRPPTEKEFAALVQAIDEGNLKKVQKLINSNRGITSAVDRTGRTPLHVAAYKGHEDIARHLISDGAELDACTPGSVGTPLHDAINERRKNIVRLLLKAGADTEVRGPQDNTAMHYAARIGDIELLALLLEKGAGVKAQDATGSTPLHYFAATAPFLFTEISDVDKTVAMLVAAGADVNARNKDEKTPLALVPKARTETSVGGGYVRVTEVGPEMARRIAATERSLKKRGAKE